MTEEVKDILEGETSAPAKKARKPNKRPHPYKGVPRNQWPDRARKENPVAQEVSDTAYDGLTLSREELSDLRKEASAEALEERKKTLRAQAKIAMLDEERAKLDPQERKVRIYIDVPAMAMINKMDESGLALNGRWFTYGKWYEVNLSRARDMLYTMWMANWNEKRIGNPSRDLKIRSRLDARASQGVPQIIEIVS